MLRFAANLSFQYQELPFLERFEAAAADGFEGVEYLFPYDYPAAQLAEQLSQHGLKQVLFNAPPGNWNAGERGIAALPGREAEFRASFEAASEYAQVLGCHRVHVMAGILPKGGERNVYWRIYRDNLGWATGAAAQIGVEVLIEPINTRNMPGYLLNHQDEAHALIAEIGAPNLKVQMDLYHCQIMDGDVAMRLRDAIPGKTPSIGHLQIASVPDRHEPDEGELNYPYLFNVLDELGYDGWIGCEYHPRAGTRAGLRWLRSYQAGAVTDGLQVVGERPSPSDPTTGSARHGQSIIQRR
jgi:hydroxypyruvate isomerase